MTSWVERSDTLGRGERVHWDQRAIPDRPGWAEFAFDSGIRISGKVGADEHMVERLRSRPARGDVIRGGGFSGDVIRSGGTVAIRERGGSRTTLTRSRPSAPPPARKSTSRVDRVFIRPDALQQLYKFGLTDGRDDLAVLETGGPVLGHRSGSDLFVTGFREDTTAKRSPTSIATNLKALSAAGDALIGDVHTHPRLHSTRLSRQFSKVDAETWRSQAEEFGMQEWLGIIVSPTMTEFGQSELSEDAWETLTLDAFICTRNGTVTHVPIESY